MKFSILLLFFLLSEFPQSYAANPSVIWGSNNRALVLPTGGFQFQSGATLDDTVGGLSVSSDLFIVGDTTLKTSLSGVVKANSGLLSASLVDVTSDITGILPIANGGTNSSTALTNDKVMISNLGAIVESATTTTQLGYLDATSSIQTQLDSKVEDLQGAYIASTQPQIIFNSTQGGLVFSDAVAPIGTPFLQILSSDALTKYLEVSASGNISTSLDINGRLEVVSTSLASLPCPVMTNAQRDLLTPIAGDCIFSSTDLAQEIFDGTNWLVNRPSGIPVLSKGALITSNGTANGEFSACADGEKLEWDSAEPSGIKCVGESVSYSFNKVVWPLDSTCYWENSPASSGVWYDVSSSAGTCSTSPIVSGTEVSAVASNLLKVDISNSRIDGYYKIRFNARFRAFNATYCNWSLRVDGTNYGFHSTQYPNALYAATGNIEATIKFLTTGTKSIQVDVSAQGSPTCTIVNQLGPVGSEITYMTIEFIKG